MKRTVILLLTLVLLLTLCCCGKKNNGTTWQEQYDLGMRYLNEGNYHGKKRKNTVDAVAASLILEGYLAYLRNHKE